MIVTSHNGQAPPPVPSLISVIVPVYKVEDLLPRCVDSILRQSYTALEIILVDDGSPDRCPEICDDFAARDPRVRVIHQHNAGLSAARNSGLDIARGAYVTFVDSDDWIHDDFIKHLVSASERHPLATVCGAFVRAVDESAVTGYTPGEFVLTVPEALSAMNTQVRLMTAWGKLYPISLFDTIRFPVGRLHEDEFVVYKLYDRSDVVVMTDLGVYYYWVRRDSIMGMHRRNPLALTDNLDALEERARYLDERNYIAALAGLQRRRARKLIVAIRATREGDMKPVLQAFRREGLRLIWEAKAKGLGRHGAALLLFAALPRIGDLVASGQRHLTRRKATHAQGVHSRTATQCAR